MRPDLFTADTERNRLLKAGLSGMARVARRDEPVRLLRGVITLLDSVLDVTVDRGFIRRLGQLSFDRRNELWRPLFQLITQFAKHLPSDVAAGRDSFGPAWLFDMNRLFQSYIAKRLHRIAASVEVREGAMRWLAVEAVTRMDRFQLKPDIVIVRRGRPDVVIDAKWKRLERPNLADALDDNDVRQVFAYARIFRTRRAALIFPAAAGTPRQASFRTKEDEGAVTVEVIEVPMRDDHLEELDRSLERLIA